MDYSFYVISHFLAGLIAIVLGILVIGKNPKRRINQIFTFSALSVTFWSVSYSIWLLARNPESALFWSRMLNLGATMIPVFYFHWILILLNKKRKILLYFYYILTTIYALFSFSGIYITGTKKILQFEYWPQMGWLYVLFLLTVWITVIFYSFYLLIQERKNARGNFREQINYVLLGSAIGFAGGSMNFPLMLGFDFIPPIGSSLVVVYPIFFSYAMIKHLMMDIRFVLRQGSVYTASLVSIIALILLLKVFFKRFLFIQTELADYLYLALGVLIFPYMQNFYYKFANNYFFTSLYDDRALIAQISENLRTTLQTKKIYQFICTTLVQNIHAKKVAIMIYSKEFRKYISEYKYGFDDKNRELVYGEEWSSGKDKLSSDQAILFDELKTRPYVKHKNILEFMRAHEIDIIIPLSIKEHSVGLLLLGRKESNDAYNRQDINVLEVIGSQAAISIQNAHHYEEIRNFSQKLEKEIEIATRDLRMANEKLQQLDKAKSEFISIASHQLRTPLTVIKGYISMILQGNFGKLDKAKKDSLQKVYESNERLIQLVENLLNISRIESGRMQLDFNTIQLEDLVDSVVDELSSYAKRKGIKLIYKKPKKYLPMVTVDEEKLRQAIINIIDNAIKYTNKGKVAVEVIQDGEYLKFSSTDTGIGVKKADIGELFKKFTRGQDTPLLNTEGTGLGLYVAKQMIDLHKGEIWVESEGEGKGSKFCFIIPANK